MFAMRPAMQLASSPGMVSSVISGRRRPIRSCNSRVMSPRTAAGSAAKLALSANSLAYSGKKMRNELR
jgi:hypothetical protein